ncbi:MAG: type III pantothenate kinase, partial [Alteriqipengyuania sp.]
MLLAIDVGNTNLVFALFDGEDLRARWRISTDGRRTGDEYAVWLFQLLGIEGVAREDITHIIFGSVVPRADHNLTVLCEKYFGITPIVAGHGEAGWGFEIDVDLPSTLGADRALNCIAAHEMIGGDMIVVDFGTATKFEVVDYN